METAGDQDHADKLMKGKLDDGDDKVQLETDLDFELETAASKTTGKKKKKKGKRAALDMEMECSPRPREQEMETVKETVRSYYTQLAIMRTLIRDKDAMMEEKIFIRDALMRVELAFKDIKVLKLCGEKMMILRKLIMEEEGAESETTRNSLESDEDCSLLSNIMRGKALLWELPTSSNFGIIMSAAADKHQASSDEEESRKKNNVQSQDLQALQLKESIKSDKALESDEDDDHKEALFEFRSEGENRDDKEQRRQRNITRLRALELEREDHENIASYRRTWEFCYAPDYGSFDDTTILQPMRYAGFPPENATYGFGVQIISVKVAEIREEEGLHWPLHVYGLMAARDSIDPRRNFLYNRTRDDCQILTQEDPYLLLTGPSRAIVLIDPVEYEVQLKAKGKTKSEDKNLHFNAFHTGHYPIISSAAPPSMTTLSFCCQQSDLDLTFAVVGRSVEATIAVRLDDGSWPDHFRGLVVSRTASLDDGEIVLLDSRDGRMPFGHHGRLKLSRCVVSVELKGKLKVDVVASQVDGNECSDVAKGQVVLTPKKYSMSTGTCDLGFCKLYISVAWSLIMLK